MVRTTKKRKAKRSMHEGTKASLEPAKKKTKGKTASFQKTFTVEDVLNAWTDNTPYGASFRALTEAEQKIELMEINNKGAAKGLKGTVKSKVLKQQYKDMVASKIRDFLKSSVVSQAGMFRPNVASERNVQLLRTTFLSVEEWVEVDADRTQGWNSEGGLAAIVGVHNNFADVK
jgi:hypothetical protein